MGVAVKFILLYSITVLIFSQPANLESGEVTQYDCK
jgi:hypothetical protein